MKLLRLLLVLSALFCGLLILAQKQQDFVYKDRAGKFRLWNLNSHSWEDKLNGPILFEGSGKPVKGRSEVQGIDLEALEMSAELEKGKGGTYLLKSADFKGAVRITQTQPAFVRTLKTETAKLEDSVESASATLSSPFEFNQTSKIDKRSVALKADRGVIVTGSLRSTSSGFRKADLTGSVDASFTDPATSASFQSASLNMEGYPKAAIVFPSPFTMSSTSAWDRLGHRTLKASGRQGRASLDASLTGWQNQIILLEIKGDAVVDLVQEKGDETKEVKKIKASAPLLVYSRETRTLVLSGGVDYSVAVDAKDKEPQGGEGHSENLEIKLNDKGEVIEYSAKSGRATLTQGAKKP